MGRGSGRWSIGKPSQLAITPKMSGISQKYFCALHKIPLEIYCAVQYLKGRKHEPLRREESNV
jgi:hypothetical protein